MASNTPSVCGAEKAETQICSSVARAFRAVDLLESNAVGLDERIQSVLRTTGPSGESSKEESFDCPLAETLASLARRIEYVSNHLNSLRFRVEL